jgi:hypothetical protein
MKSWYLLCASVPTAIAQPLDAAEQCNQDTQAGSTDSHVETGRDGAIGVDGGLNGVHGGEVRGGADFDAVSDGGMKGGGEGRGAGGSVYLCSQPERLGLELRRYSVQEGESLPEPAVYS